MNHTNKRIRKDHKIFGTFLVALSGLMYGLVGYFGMQLFFEGFSVPAMLFWRFLVAALWMLLIGILTRRNFRKLFSNFRLMLRLASVGAVSYAGCSAFYYLSSQHIGTGPAMVIFFSFPVFVMLFSLIFEQAAINRYVIIALVMVVTGLILLNGSGQHNLSNKGIVLALIASFSYGIYVYCSQHSSSMVDSLWLTLFICVGCSAIFLVFAYATNTFQVPANAQAWKNILILGILATAIPIQLLLNGLKYISSMKASILSVLEPVVTVVIGVLFLQESLEWMQIFGILVILSGAMVIQFEKQPEFKAKTPLK